MRPRLRVFEKFAQALVFALSILQLCSKGFQLALYQNVEGIRIFYGVEGSAAQIPRQTDGEAEHLILAMQSSGEDLSACAVEVGFEGTPRQVEVNGCFVAETPLVEQSEPKAHSVCVVAKVAA